VLFTGGNRRAFGQQDPDRTVEEIGVADGAEPEEVARPRRCACVAHRHPGRVVLTASEEVREVGVDHDRVVRRRAAIDVEV
jgi:hypothetical protein